MVCYVISKGQYYGKLCRTTILLQYSASEVYKINSKYKNKDKMCVKNCALVYFEIISLKHFKKWNYRLVISIILFNQSYKLCRSSVIVKLLRSSISIICDTISLWHLILTKSWLFRLFIATFRMPAFDL